MDLDINAAYTILKGSADTYSFKSVSPEFRWRFNGKDASGPFLAIGSPLLSGLDNNPNNATATTPTPVLKTNVYVVAGYSFKWSASDLVPVIGLGWMNQQIVASPSSFDSGGFFYIGFTGRLLGQ